MRGDELLAGLAQPVTLQPRGDHAELEAPAAWDLVDIERYRTTWVAAHDYFSLNMAASKG
ncbi:hypothetical protein [Roseateles sp. P5_E1]